MGGTMKELENGGLAQGNQDLFTSFNEISDNPCGLEGIIYLAMLEMATCCGCTSFEVLLL